MKNRLLAKISILTFLLIFIYLFSGCSSSRKFITSEEAVYESNAAKKHYETSCNNTSYYISDSLYKNKKVVKTIKVNVHFMNLSDSSINFSQEQGTQYAKTLIYQANNIWAENHQMNLPLGNNTPILPTRVRLQLTPDTSITGDDGIYFHYNDTLGYFNTRDRQSTLFSSKHYKRYGRQKGDVINIFLMESPPDSLASPTYKKANKGIGYPSWVKVIGGYKNSKEFFLNEKGDTIYLGPWNLARLLNHELGHSFGLRHTWKYNDGCDDTPQNPNCWNYSNSGPCDSLVSNNLMDYNTYRTAVTPCQIGIMHSNFSKPNSSQREKLVKNFCFRDSTFDLTLSSNDTIHIRGYHDLYGNLTIGINTVVVVNCDLQMPSGSKIVIKKGGRLILNDAKLYNACDLSWQGIESTSVSGEAVQLVLIGNSSIEDAENWHVSDDS